MILIFNVYNLVLTFCNPKLQLILKVAVLRLEPGVIVEIG
jgi:hypothetical protein